MKYLLTIFTIIFFISNGYTQKKSVLDEFGSGKKRVLSSDNLTYYGMDFSLFKINNPRKVGEEDIIIEYIPDWIYEFEKEWVKSPYDSKMQRLMKKKMSEHKVEIQNSYTLLKDKEWVTFTSNVLKPETLESKIKSYNKHSDKGIGFVIIIETFSKPNKRVIANYTFFDVSTSEILWSLKIFGLAGDSGMTMYWARGLKSSFLHFIRYYDKVRRQND